MTRQRSAFGKGVAKKRLVPSRDIEKAFLAQIQRASGRANVCIAGVDEVGRGSLAGPVSVGVAVIGSDTSEAFPALLRDSKQLSAAAREALVEPCEQWVKACAVGSASPEEINAIGIIGALRLAAGRAAAEVAKAGVHIDGVILDGSHNWWSPTGLFEMTESGVLLADGSAELPADVPVQMVVKGDAQCAVVAAASVLAKVHRDAHMSHLSDHYPQYGWERNKGYSSPEHVAALGQYGPCAQHRTAWHLPGVAK